MHKEATMILHSANIVQFMYIIFTAASSKRVVLVFYFCFYSYR